MGAADYTHSGFFAFRTPLLPIEEITTWAEGLRAMDALEQPDRLEDALTADRALLRERLRRSIARPEVREALFLASPSLDERIAHWLENPEGKKGRKVELALVRYFVRMVVRPTPFGLFAGGSVGRIGTSTSLLLSSRKHYRRHTRLDTEYLCGLCEALLEQRELRRELVFRPNSSLYTAAGRLHYAEARTRGRTRSHHLVAIEFDEALIASLERAAEGSTRGALAEALIDEEITLAEAEAYVDELIDCQVLAPDLTPPVTGNEAIHDLIDQLAATQHGLGIAERLRGVQGELEEIDATGLGAPPERYREIARQLGELPAEASLPRLFQVDMAKPALDASLDERILEEISQAVEALLRLPGAEGTEDRFAAFRRSFVERYGDREIPLGEALDDEVGIGFEPSSAPAAEASPLLAGLAFPGTDPPPAVAWGPARELVFRKLGDVLAAGEHELVLEPQELDALPDSGEIHLPKAVQVMATLLASPDGDPQIWFQGISGPPGACLLARFCHMDKELERNLLTHLQSEERQRPDALHAEVVHLPQGRVGNILARPVLRDYEIPFLGRSGTDRDRQIPVTDLYVSVKGDRVVLRSERLGTEIVPRLSAAHNHWGPGLGIYRFLCALQSQGVRSWVGWVWGPFENAPFLPRVRIGRVILEPARWRIAHDEIKSLAKAVGTERFSRIQELRKARGIPRFVGLMDGDNVLPVDFHNPLTVEMFVELVKAGSSCTVRELDARPAAHCASGDEGHFVHELVIPLVQEPSAPADTRQRRIPPPVRLPSYPPGSNWLYAKLYSGASTADRVLREVVAPVARRALESGAADRWFFLRNNESGFHLRVRLHGDPDRLHREVLPELQSRAAGLLGEGRIWRVQLDTYQPEYSRYGGVEGIGMAEQLFWADSRAALEIVEMIAGDEGTDARWRLTLRGMHMLLEDIGFGLQQRHQVVASAARGFGREFNMRGPFERQILDRFRAERAGLEALLDPARDATSPLAPGIQALERRRGAWAPVMRELRKRSEAGRLTEPLSGLAGSFLHMHANRMLRSAHRAQEMLIYHFLERLYDSELARARKGRGE